MAAPRKLLSLVEKFERNVDAYKTGHYNEAQVRKEFIDPLFKLLGWDMDNEEGLAEAYKDVIHEDAIKIGGFVKAPDYCFRIGGTRKFFLEAKKPAISIKDDTDPAFQLRRYAWSAKLPLSILTDFEEFAIYDCCVKPVKTDKASIARTRFIKYTEYADRWDEIASVFSKDAILKGSFDKYADSHKAKRGTASVDEAFLKEVESWRDMLARNIALRNSKLTQRELNVSVQSTIDRIIFLRICEDRKIEDYGQLMALQNGTQVYRRLCKLFRDADARYNSGIFHFNKEKDRATPPDELTLGLKIDDRVLKEIFKSLYYPESPYEFSVLSADILGQVYEQFLGKVISLTSGHRASIEYKPEVKKAGGVYYTPTYIVDYIVKNTVGKLLDAKKPGPRGGVSKLRILDPACGSGSFLIGAYQYLLDWHRDKYVDDDDPKKHRKVLYQAAGGEWRLTTAERKRILLNNIYGVDIDPQAVEVTKLSLLLKVLEGESGETLTRQLKMFHERALPDLGNNIKCGNSLIGPDFYDNRQMNLMDMDADEQYRINAFDWHAEFPDTMKSGGFDAVIGNPPYGATFTDEMSNYLKEKLSTFVWRGESYLVLVERAFQLLIKGGLFGFIIPDTFLNLGFTRSLRMYLLQNTLLREIVLLPSNVFPATTVDTTLLFAKKSKKTPNYHNTSVIVKAFSKKQFITTIEEPHREFRIDTRLWHEQQAFNVQSNKTELALIKKLERDKLQLNAIADLFYGIKVYQVGKGKPPQTPEIRDKKPFTSNICLNKKGWLPFYDGKHIGRYEVLWKGDNWVYYGPWLAEPRKPEIFEGEKILIRKIVGQTLVATYIPETLYCNTLLSLLKIRNDLCSYQHLLGILNSRLIGWYFHKKFQISIEDTFPQILIRDIQQFPVSILKNNTTKHLSRLVERMLDLNKKLQKTKTEHDKTVLKRQIETTDRQINNLVYELYGLTKKEIAIVEESAK